MQIQTSCSIRFNYWLFFKFCIYFVLLSADMYFFNFLQATGSWDYSVRVWAISVNDYTQPANITSQENDGKEINNRTCLLRCLTGHTGNIHTVAFSRAEMLVSHPCNLCIIVHYCSLYHVIYIHLFIHYSSRYNIE